MTAIHETAYPRIRSNLSDKELAELYTPTQEDLVFVNQKTQSTVAAFGGLLLYKTFQRLGYFPSFDTLPPRLIAHIARVIGVKTPSQALVRYEQRGFRKWHLPLIRSHFSITAFDDGGRRVLVEAVIEASQSKDILADIINMGIESLVAARYELPAFSTLRRAAMKARAQVNRGYYHQVLDALSLSQRASINQLLTHDESDTTSQFQRLKREPKQPTTKQIREHIDHLRWLESLNTAGHVLDGVPETKLERFAAEAKALNVSRMNEIHQSKRFTLAVALIRVRTAQALDDLAEMFIRRMQKLHRKAKEALEAYRRQHQEQTDTLISLLGKIAQSWQTNDPPEQKVLAVNALIGDDAEEIEQQCEAHMGYAGNNYLPFLPALFRNHRKTCLDVLECLAPTSTSADTTLEEAITFVLRHRNARTAQIPVTGSAPLDTVDTPALAEGCHRQRAA